MQRFWIKVMFPGMQYPVEQGWNLSMDAVEQIASDAVQRGYKVEVGFNVEQVKRFAVV